MIKRIVCIIAIGVFLSGCSNSKPINNNLLSQTDKQTETKEDKSNELELEYKKIQEAEAKKKAEEEAVIKAEQETKRKEEEKAKAEQEIKVQQPTKPVVQPKQAASPKPSPAPVQSKTEQAPQPAVQDSQKTSTSSTAAKHPVEYKADIEEQILVLVNQERAKVGAKPLAMNETLRNMARYKSNDMLQYEYFDHTSPNIGGLSNLAKKFNYSYTALGENIWMSKASSADYLRQNTTAAKIMNGWMNSPGHKANVLNTSFGKIGIGVTLSSDGLSHASQEFSN